ncbi:TauD/TfdA dioxygenase family protein [Piscicoccus intestinalis]|uniref:TauD/TfdA dioxygenase family protein n=1 Tax=Piscicoccus intestinalis TaxID=746033 RepID=UPI00083978C4|nr:TauD/TfdA family dioxygenase [Piscicoccus intestinalis]
MTITATGAQITRLTDRIGARLTGLDLTGDLDEHTVATLREALLAHKVLVIPNTPLDLDRQRRIAAALGPLTLAHPTVSAAPGAPEVLAVDSERNVANSWHTDVTFIVNPPAISTLAAKIIPPFGGETLIADTAAAYRELPEPLRALADSLRAVHTNVHDYVTSGDNDQYEDADDDYRSEFIATRFESEHPLVRVHPETGERGLFLGGFAQRIVGLGGQDSRDLIRLFQSHITRPRNVVRVTWEPDQLVIFDNRITQHYAIDNYAGLPRKLTRVTVGGDIPVGVDGARSRALTGDSSHYSPIPD